MARLHFLPPSDQPAISLAVLERADEPQLGLTHRQLALLDYLRSYIAMFGVAPSYDEMRRALDLSSKSGIHRLITALVERGHIRRLRNRARSVALVKVAA